MKSMTAYGRSEQIREDRRFLVEIRSLNNRYRDIILRLPKGLQALEQDIRGLVSAAIRRGRVEVTLQMESVGEAPPAELQLNEPLLRSYLRMFERVCEITGIRQDPPLHTFLQMGEVVTRTPWEPDLEHLWMAIRDAMRDALSSLNEMRDREGLAVRRDFVNRVDALERYLNDVNDRVPVVVESYRDRLGERVQELMGNGAVDSDRLAQEVVLFAERSDITEELVRMRSHLAQFRTYLDAGDAVGRRLDFLIQEMNREVNTMGAKASDAGVSGIVVEMKSELEKLREQVQNIE